MKTLHSIALLIVVVALHSIAMAQKGKPRDTRVIAVLPSAVDCELDDTLCPRLTGDQSNVYQTSSADGVNAILIGNDGNLSLQFDVAGKGKNATFVREIRFDSSLFVAGSGPGSPIPAPGPVEPDFLFAAPDDGTGINCDMDAENCPAGDGSYVGTFGTVTGIWPMVRLSYRFTAAPAEGGNERDWNLRWHDTATDRFVTVECLETDSQECQIWKLSTDPSIEATLSSRGTGTDLQETGGFVVPTEIIVCREEVGAAVCASYLSMP